MAASEREQATQKTGVTRDNDDKGDGRRTAHRNWRETDKECVFLFMQNNQQQQHQTKRTRGRRRRRRENRHKNLNEAHICLVELDKIVIIIIVISRENAYNSRI